MSSAEKPALGLVEPTHEDRRPLLIGPDLNARRPDFRLSGAGRKAKDLIGLLMSHGARIRRAARPRCTVELAVVTPEGHPAVGIWFG